NINFKTVSLGLYQSPIDTRKNTTVSNPFQELFVWAIVSRRFDLADYAWENVDDPIMTSLMARLVLQTEATKLSPREQRKRDQYFEYSRIYEKRAFNLIEPENLEKDETLEYNLILRERHANWCSFSCLDIGLKAKAKMFLSHDCCQYALRKLWLGKISIRYSSITLFFIFCIYWLVAISTRSESVFDSDFRRSKRFEKSRTGYLKSCIAFYGAPVNKFSLHVVAFISFLFLYAYVVMYCPLARMFTLPDLIAHVWLLIYFIEVLREMVYVYPYGRRVSHLDHFIDWWKSSWNILNFLIMLVATIAFSCRWFVTTTLTRFLYASSYFLIMLNILRLYTISKHLGPMVSMLKHMFIRTLNFAMVFVVFLVGYAVAVQALLYQQAGKSLSLMILSDMFFMPFFQTFGELFTDSLPESKYGDSTTPASLTAVLYSLLMAVYLFIGNVLLLNLLIAIFSRDIERVQEEAEEVWKFELYVLHNEYERKPILPPPLTLIIYIYWIIVYIFKRCHKRGYCGFTAHKRNSRQNRKLIEFRKMCLSRYLANKKEMERNSLEARTDRIEQASQNLLELNEAIVDNTVKIRTKSRHIKKHTKIIDHKTENINETTAAINLTTDTIENMAVRLKESGTNLRKTTDNIAAGQEILSSQMYDVHHRLDQLHTKNALLRACKMEELILILMDFIKEISKKEDLDNKNLQNDSGYMEDRNMSAKKALYCDKKQFPVANIETKTSTPLDGRNIVKRSLVKEFQRMKITDPTVRKRKNRMHVSESELSDAPEYQGCQEFTPRRRCNRLQRKKYRQYDFNPTIPSKLIDKMKCSPLISSIHHYLGLGESGNIELIGTLKSGPKFNPTFGYKK
ncbi:transient receptor potential cation channel subfamily M member 1-like, partial [Saccoglossus kowalevskii]